LTAGRDGWRFHLVSAGACRASIVVGDEPRLIAVETRRNPDRSWAVHVRGVRPDLVIAAPSSERLAFSLVADERGNIHLRRADASHETMVDQAAAPPAPPYEFAFGHGHTAAGCAAVIVEIPFPYRPMS
jgi:hypothetical protein